MQQTVSVLIPSYNGAAYLGETLQSILDQTYAPAEILVVDDGSTDNTREVVAGFGHRIRYHFIPNGGVCHARNVAASLATSTHLAFCDSDDLWRFDKLHQQMALHDRNPAIQFSFTNFALVQDGVWARETEFDQAPDRSFPPYSLPGFAPVVVDTPFYDRLIHFQPVRPSTFLVTRNLFEQIGRFDPELGRNPSEDVEFTLRCARHAPIGIVREPVVGIRKHTANFSGSDYRNLRGQKEVFEYALKHHAVNDHTRALLEKEIVLRRIDAAYYAFRLGDFAEVINLLGPIPAARLDRKARLKLMVSRLPAPLARLAQARLVGE